MLHPPTDAMQTSREPAERFWKYYLKDPFSWCDNCKSKTNAMDPDFKQKPTRQSRYNPTWVEKDKLSLGETEKPCAVEGIHKADVASEEMKKKKKDDNKNNTGSLWLRRMLSFLEEGLLPQPSIEDIAHILHQCRKRRDCEHALLLYAYMRKSGLDAHRSLGNYLVLMLVEVGSMHDAQQVFDRLVYQTEQSWNWLITGYIKHGKPHHALSLYKKMQEDNSVHPSGHTFVALLKACAKLKDLERGLEIHAKVATIGLLERDLFVGSSLVDMYAKCGSLAKAQRVFNYLPVRDVVSWNALITGYAKHGHSEEALKCFEQMQLEGVSPTVVTFVCSLKACGNIGATDKGRKIHAEIERKGLLKKNLFVGNTLVDMYAKCGSLAKAHEVFDKLPVRDVVSWNALIAGYAEHGHGKKALKCFEQMQLEGVSPDVVTFVCSLKACGSVGAAGKGREIHAEIARKSLLERDLVVGNALVDMYAKCGLLVKAQHAFDKLPVRNVVSWNALITGYVKHGHGEEALKCFKQMQLDGVSPDAVTFICSLKACGSTGAIDKGCEIHEEVERKGLLKKDLFVSSALVDMYAKCGSIFKAQEVFDKLPVRGIVSWTALIAGYVEHGYAEKALKCFEQMKLDGFSPDAVTFVCSLKACGSIGDTDKGRVIHAEIERKGFLERDLFVGSTLVDMYAKCGSLAKAQQVFDKLPVRDVVSWNALIAGYTEHGRGEEALKRFEQMQLEGVSPSAVTFVCSLKACGSIGATDKGKELHAAIERNGLLESDLYVGNTLVDMYAKCGLVSKAQEMFDKLPVRDVVSWNALLAGYAEHEHGEEALKCFERMQLDGVSPNAITFVCSLKACGSIGATDKGCEIHAEIERQGLLERDLSVGSTLVDMYAKCGVVANAQEVFDKLPVRDIVSWTALIAAYAEHGHGEEALECFEQMQLDGFYPDAFTFVCSLKACGSIGAIDKGQEIHADIERKGLLERDLVVGNTLVNMYVKFGSLAKAQQVFDKLPVRDNISWNALLAGYTQLGESENVFHIFNRMLEEGVKPGSVTFIIVLNTCSRAGLFDKGQSYFEAMSKDYGIIPTLEHHTCMVDLLGRAGQLDKAVAMIKKLPFCPDLAMWRTILAACINWGNVELGRQAFEHAVHLDEKHAAAYVLMSKIYVEANRFETLRVEKQPWKQTGHCWIDINEIVHSSLHGGRRHTKSKSINAKIELSLQR